MHMWCCEVITSEAVEVTNCSIRPFWLLKRLTGEMFVSDIAIFVLKRDVKLQLTN